MKQGALLDESRHSTLLSVRNTCADFPGYGKCTPARFRTGPAEGTSGTSPESSDAVRVDRAIYSAGSSQLGMHSMSSSRDVTVKIEADDITDTDSFHAVFAATLGFPDFYGRNMNAWIDCLTCLDDPAAGMTAVHVSRGESLVLVVDHAQGLEERCPQLFAAMVECAAFVNWRRVEVGMGPVLTLTLN